ncbi:M56 family metallopeptidase [Paraflavitalea speifideaquila]|uniref:M56 family metallopeptidase n=1 Tax=Paraflavitalea speifideaquila TaxID=3076558 RepID=UPI0028E90787|nr:M56 family metallopeptidase [Paraflavitalea speifideiaquila]
MQYLLKLSIALTVVYLFYWLLLRRLTFYNWNRWYLLVYSLFAFLIPLINVFDLLQQHGLQNAAVISYIPALTPVGTVVAAREPGVDGWLILAIVFTAGSGLMLGRLLLQYLSLKRLQSSATLLSDGTVKLYHVDQQIIPFSTGSAIYVNRHLHNEQELKEIIRHEFIHVKQRHSVDLWWSEILCIINWYNPFAWLIRKAIRQNLEFIADDQVLQSGLDRKQYQYLLLKVTGIAAFSIAPNFNFSSLKNALS